MGDTIGNNHFDAIVIGSGMSGGWAAKEFTEKGFKTLVLERGREVRHIKDYPTTNMMPWEFGHRGEIPYEVREANPSVSRCYAFREDAMHFFVKDTDHPYVQEKPFDWIRGYQVGGKSIMWARQTQRWSDFDFEGPARDGYATDWPIRYKDLAPWYSYVEKFVGISGNKDGLAPIAGWGIPTSAGADLCGNLFCRFRPEDLQGSPGHLRPLRPPDRADGPSPSTGQRSMSEQEPVPARLPVSAVITTAILRPSPGQKKPATLPYGPSPLFILSSMTIRKGRQPASA